MEQIFISVLNRSLTAAYCVVVVPCIRMCIRRFPKVYSYALWLVVFVRFAVPFLLESVHVGDVVRKSTKEEWDAFWDGQFLAAEVMEFEALPDVFE